MAKWVRRVRRKAPGDSRQCDAMGVKCSCWLLRVGTDSVRYTRRVAGSMGTDKPCAHWLATIQTTRCPLPIAPATRSVPSSRKNTLPPAPAARSSIKLPCPLTPSAPTRRLALQAIPHLR